METENSKLLQYLLKVTEELVAQKEDGKISINALFAAVLLFCTDKSVKTEEFDSQEVQIVQNMIKSIVKKDVDSSVVDTLLSAPVGFADVIYFELILQKSKEFAEENGDDVVTADLVIKCLIKSPTNEIENLLNLQNDSEKKDGFSTAGLKNATASLSGRLGKSKERTEEEPDEEPKEEKEEKKEESKKQVVKDAPTKEKIEKLTETAKELQKVLSNAVLGQENAIETVTSGYFQGGLRAITDKKAKKPTATYLFAGPPGVGKTFLAEKFAAHIGLPFKRFDMTEYALPSAVTQLCGYKGAFEGLLTGFVAKNPKCVLLFDEIEKSYIDVINLFLQVLDAGRLRDAHRNVDVSFKDTIVIFTTNAGKSVYDGAPTNNLSHISRKTILKSLEQEIDPRTREPIFPAAICSRFATGNVVMFNHMEAHILREIASKEIMKHVTEFEKETKINCKIADEIPSCVVFGEGGHADARTVTARAGAFFSKEVYELFRLISTDDNGCEIKNIENINISVSLDDCKEEVIKLFKPRAAQTILVLSSQKNSLAVASALPNVEIKIANTANDAIKITKAGAVDLILCDLYTGLAKEDDKLNIEDIYSDGTNFFEYACENLDIPLYVICDEQNTYTDEEMFSLIKQGARGKLDLSNKEKFAERINEVFSEIHQQESMIELAKTNKVATYKTAQTISNDGKTANVSLYDIELETAVDAEDATMLVSDMSRPNVLFEDVIGGDSAKEELQFIIDYVKDPKGYSSKGLPMPKGILLYGPPGTGKTMLAKALAGETNLTFINTAGSKFLDKYVGVGSQRVEALFRTARKYAPAIIFIDEVDAVAKERSGEHAAPDDILTTFLAQMDGFDTNPKKPVFVIAATNYAIKPDGTKKVLDGAFVRRFDRHVYIDLPDKKDRIKFMQKQMEKNPAIKLSDSEIENIAIRSTGMSLANLAAVINYSLKIAVKLGKNFVDGETFEEAFESYNYGEEKKWDETELKKTAYHEAGHAFLCWQSGIKPSYLTIVARGNHGGYMQYGDTEKIGIRTKKMLLERIRTALGGRAAELVFFGDEEGLTTGASADLRSATAVAKSIICQYGMDDSIGLAVIDETEASEGAIAKEVRTAVNAILKQELVNAKTILKENEKAMVAIVNALMEKDHLTGPEIDKIFTENTK